MTIIQELSHFLRRPKYPVIVDIDGHVFAAKTMRTLFGQLSRFELVEKKHYEVIDMTGECWTLVVFEDDAVISPIAYTKKRSKLELVRRFNNRKNKPADEVEYSEKSLSSKRVDRVLADLTDRLIEADKK